MIATEAQRMQARDELIKRAEGLRIAAAIEEDSRRYNTASMIGMAKKEGANRAAAIARGER